MADLKVEFPVVFDDSKVTKERFEALLDVFISMTLFNEEFFVPCSYVVEADFGGRGDE
jgi:hypothetical protein